MQLTDALRKEYEDKFAAVTLLPGKQAALKTAVNAILKGRAHYEAAEKETGVPWFLIGVLHMRESGCSFSTYLGNGDPLDKVTTHVPAGRGPFSTWAEGAIDALKIDGLSSVKVWDLATILFYVERFNGFGYRNKGLPSPYLWSFTNQYASGKYVADGRYSSSTVDTQPGCSAMLWQMILMQVIPNLAKEVITMATDTLSPTAVTPTKNTSTGVTVSPAQNLATHIIFGVGAVLAALGLTQVHSIYDVVTNSGLLGGGIVSGLALVISRFSVNGSNDNTLAMIDKVLVALTPQQNVNPSNPTQAA